MGGCLSKKSSTCSSCTTSIPKSNPTHQQIKPQPLVEKKKSEEETVKKEIFIIKHRKSHDIDRQQRLSEEEKDEVNPKASPEIVLESGNIGFGDKKKSPNNDSDNNGGPFVAAAATVRTSSCTKEEVDAILIQCGRLSRSSSTGKAGNLSGSCGSGESNSQRGRKYSGSKRSYDFDNDNGSDGKDNAVAAAGDKDDVENGVVGESSHRHRQRQRQSRMAGSPSKGRRRTPSREREQQQRSGSRERGNGTNGSGRRVSKSPGRRSESPITTNSGGGNSSQGSGNGGNGNNRPGKMVSVPATVSSLVMDKSNNAGGGSETVSASAVKRIQVKRNAGAGGDAAGTRTAASPRARSPARGNVKVLNENQNNQQQPLSLSRSNSRKAEHSPYRRNPLSEIDSNVVNEQMSLPGSKASDNVISQAPIQKPNSDYTMNNKVVVQGTENKISNSKGIADHNASNLNFKAKEQQHLIAEVTKASQAYPSNVAVNMVASGPEYLKPQALTRSRSSRLSRDFDINPESLSNPPPSYTALLLEDIQNFHQKSSTPMISLPPCLSKACSILEAVADLNSSTSSNLSSTFQEDKRRVPAVEQFNKLYENASFGAHNLAGKKGFDTNAPFVQSEVVATNDLMHPTFHKYVTVSRGGTIGGEDIEEQESSGSNSIVGGAHQYWISPSSWEPNSADSTDRWTSSRSTIRETSVSPVPFQRHALSKPDDGAEDARMTLLNGKKSHTDQQPNGIGRGRIGLRGLQSVPPVTAAST